MWVSKSAPRSPRAAAHRAGSRKATEWRGGAGRGAAWDGVRGWAVAFAQRCAVPLQLLNADHSLMNGTTITAAQRPKICLADYDDPGRACLYNVARLIYSHCSAPVALPLSLPAHNLVSNCSARPVQVRQVRIVEAAPPGGLYCVLLR